MRIGIISQLIEALHQHGVKTAVISPGSRSAPLTLAFARYQGIKKFVIPDERSAGYMALGISQASHNPVVIICTSGTAVYNLAPAAAEAFYQQIPLILLTADRPAEWIDQADGQSIHQEEIFGKNVKHSYNMPVDFPNQDSEWHAVRIISDAMIKATTFPAGPVHINFPFREPLFSDLYANNKETKIKHRVSVNHDVSEEAWAELTSIWNKSSRILGVAGQSHSDMALEKIISDTATKINLPVICDVIANLNGMLDPFIYHHDVFLTGMADKEEKLMKPDLLITFGKSVLSKNLKLFLRRNNPEYHFHLQSGGYVPDTFQSITHIIPLTPEKFFHKVLSDGKLVQVTPVYKDTWMMPEKGTIRLIDNFFPKDQFTELEAIKMILDLLPAESNLHLANSLPVRLVNYIGLNQRGVEVFSNRGTSGIDGCTSTAVGVSLTTKKINFLITGDMAFFYDRNALWHNYELNNLRIIILNNHGGGIFRMLDGPDKLPELKEYFETDQKLIAVNTAKDFGAKYFNANDAKTLNNILKDFFSYTGTLAILEIETNSDINKKMFVELKNEIKKIWN